MHRLHNLLSIIFYVPAILSIWSTLILPTANYPCNFFFACGATNTIRHVHTGRTPLNGWSAHRRGHHLHYTQHLQERETSLLTAGFEPAISASELPPAYALDWAANEIGNLEYIKKINKRTTVVNTVHREQSEKTTTGSSMKKLQEHNFVFKFSFINKYLCTYSIILRYANWPVNSYLVKCCLYHQQNRVAQTIKHKI